MLTIPKFILYGMKASKARKIHCFFLKTGPHFLSLLYFFFFHKMTSRKIYMQMYLRCPTLIQKKVSKNILFFAVGITFFIANVSDFTRILLVKIQNFELSYLHKKLSYASFFR
jgi:hypothetical protein